VREPTLGGFKNMIAAGALRIGLQSRHVSSTLDKEDCLLAFATYTAK
jgi:hypothetical protein